MTNPKLALIPSGYKNSKVYSILPNDGSGDFTFARNSGGTRLNKQGLIEQMQTYGSQLLNNSDFTSTSDWTVNNTGSATSVIENGYLHINTSSDYTEATQSIGLTAGDTYRVDYEILESTAGTISIIGNGGASTIIPSTVGKHTIEYDAQAVFAVKRTTGSTNIKIAYIKVYKVQYNTPRLDWSDSNCPSLLLESQSTNLITYSEDFSNSSWIKNSTGTGTNPTLDFGYISPDGSVNATKITFNIGTGSLAVDLCLFKTNISAINGVASIYLKGNTGGEDISFLAGNNRENIILTNSWKRYTLSSTSLSQLVLRLRGDQSTNKSCTIYVWGAQVEQGHATSYIPTYAGTSTRLADTCTDAGDATIFNDSEGVLYAEVSTLGDILTNKRISISDGTNTNRIVMFFNANINTYAISSNGAGNVITNSTNPILNNKIAISYNGTSVKTYINGLQINISTFGGFNSNTLNVLNFTNGNLTEPFYGKVKDVRYYDTALTDAELTELTT